MSRDRRTRFNRQRVPDLGLVAGAAAPLRWAPHPLRAGTVEVDLAATPDFTCEAGKSYLFHCTAPVTVAGGVVIQGNGCEDITWIGGEINLPGSLQTGFTANSRRGLFIKDYVGRCHIEGIRLRGAGMAEGIDHDTQHNPGGSQFTMQNVRIDEMYVTTAEATGWGGQHPDCFQTWGGPQYLRIDKFTGYTPYQGMFFQPKQFAAGANIAALDMSRVNIVALPQSPNTDMALPFQFVHDFPISAYQVYGGRVAKAPESVALHYTSNWKLNGLDIRLGVPAGGDFVPAGASGVGIAGIGYVSPGYLS